MRLKLFILTLSIATALSLAYAWQQTEIIKLAYLENKSNKFYKELLDKNRYLRYNLINHKSSSYLGNKLLDNNTNFEIPAQSQMLTLVLPRERISDSKRQSGQLRYVGADIVKEGIYLSAFKIQDAWPISVIKSYINKQAQAQDGNNK